MKKTLLNDFVLKLSLVFCIAFIISGIITYLYFDHLIFTNQKIELKRLASFVLKDRLSGRIIKIGRQSLSFYPLSKGGLSTIKTELGADFIALLNEKGEVENSVNLPLIDLKGGKYIEYALTQASEIQILHSITQERFKEKDGALEERVVVSIFTPLKSGKHKKILWVGFYLDKLYEYLFKDMVYLGLDVVVIATKSGQIGSPFQFDRINEFLNSEKDSAIFNNRGERFLLIKMPFYGFNNEFYGYLVVGKKYAAIEQMLDRYILSILLIFLISSTVGLVFLLFYFRKIYGFFKKFLRKLDGILQRDFSFPLKENFGIKELDLIAAYINKMADELNRYLNKMEEEVKIRIKEMLEINKAIRILDKQSNFDMLVETAKKFLADNLGYKVINLDECVRNMSCMNCHLKLFSYQLSDGDTIGLCVETSKNKQIFDEEFLSLFEEVFRINCERINNLKKKDEGFYETNLLSEVLFTLFEKKSLQDIFMYILDCALKYCKADASFIGIYDRKESKVYLKFFLNIRTEEFKKLSFPAHLGLAGLVIRERRGIFVENYFNDPRLMSPFVDVVKMEGLVSNIAVPIFYKDEIYGILYVAYRKQKKGIGKEIQFLEKLSYAVSLAIEKEMLIIETKKKENELRSAYNEIVEKRKEINNILKSYKEANAELEAMNRELNEQYEIVKRSLDEINRLNKAKDMVLGILSHELKTPITIVRGYLDTLLSNKFNLSNEVLSILSSAKKSLQTLNSIVEDVLDFVKLEAGKVTLRKMPFTLRNIYDFILFEVENILKERELILEFEGKEDICVYIDGIWFKKAIMNVVMNAIKFTPNGRKIIISGELVKKERLMLPTHVYDRPIDAEEYFVLKVIDQGLGIDPQEINAIFEKFYEGGDIKTHFSSRYKFQAKGLGMGLSLTRQIVKLHGGVVFAESKGFDPNTLPGSIFTIVVPNNREEEVTKRCEHKRKKILLVESEFEIARYLEIVLAKDFEYHLATETTMGYKKALEIYPDLILINVNVPQDGYELCSMLKENKETKKIPVILYVTGGEAIDEIRATSVKANMIFSPIFDIDNLKRVVNFYVRREELHHEKKEKEFED